MPYKSLFFIALIPPEPLRSLVQKLKARFSSSFSTKKALNSPPHITLIPPFRTDEAEITSIVNQIEEFVLNESTFEITLMGFGAFQPRVIYIDVEPNNNLESLQKRLSSTLMVTNEPKQFKPHLTIATRDLTPEKFRRAWNIYKNEPFNESFHATAVYLLKHNGRSWDIYQEYPFGRQDSPV